MKGSVGVVCVDSVTEVCLLTLPASTVLAADVCAACVQGTLVVLLVNFGVIVDDMNNGVVVGRAVVGVGLSRHFRTPTSSS